MKRRLLNLLSAMSLLLCVGVCVLWLRSFGSADGLQWLQSDLQYASLLAVRSGHSGFDVEFLTVETTDPVEEPVAWGTEICSVPTGISRGRYYNTGRPWPCKFPAIAGCYYYTLKQTHQWAAPGHGDPTWKTAARITSRWRVAGFPHWMAAGVTLVLPVSRFLGHWLDRRRRIDTAFGLCPACRYDLRATPERCPECGREATGTG